MKRFWMFSFALFAMALNAQRKWTLQECVNYAVQNNLQVVGNQYTAKNQKNNLQVAQKDYLPSVSGSIGNNVSFGQTAFGTSSIRNDLFRNDINVGANILLYNNGRLEKNIRKIEFDVQASQYDIETVKNDISLQVAQQYLTVLLNKEVVKISESAMENAQKIYNRAKITTDVGTTAKTVLAEASAALSREKQNLKTAEINVGRSLFDLAQILQFPDYQSFDIEDVPLSDKLSEPLYTADKVLEAAYETQPQIKAAESRIKSAEAQTELTKTSFWPTVSANAGLGTFYNNLLNTNNVGIPPSYDRENGFFQQYKDNFGQQVGVSANIPIFNKGITKLQVEQAKIGESIAKNTLDTQKQTIKQNVQKAQFDAQANYEAYVAAVEAEESSKLALDFADKSYQAGRSTVYDLNNARNNYANARGATAQAKYNYVFSLKLLDFYAGIPLTL